MQKQIAAGIAFILLIGCQRSTSLDWNIGKWHGTRHDDEDTFKITVQVEHLRNGQLERLQVESTPQPYVGFIVRDRDASGNWAMFYANSTRSTISRLTGKVEETRSTWESINPSSAGRMSRVLLERIDVDHWRRTNLASEDDGKTWKLLFTDELERDSDRP